MRYGSKSTARRWFKRWVEQGVFDELLSNAGELVESTEGFKAYGSDRLDEQLAALGVDMISPHRANRKQATRTQDGRKPRRCGRRWMVERTIAWIQHFRRLCIRWEKSTMTFQGCLSFACSVILLSRVSPTISLERIDNHLQVK